PPTELEREDGGDHRRGAEQSARRAPQERAQRARHATETREERAPEQECGWIEDEEVHPVTGAVERREGGEREEREQELTPRAERGATGRGRGGRRTDRGEDGRPACREGGETARRARTFRSTDDECDGEGRRRGEAQVLLREDARCAQDAGERHQREPAAREGL